MSFKNSAGSIINIPLYEDIKTPPCSLEEIGQLLATRHVILQNIEAKSLRSDGCSTSAIAPTIAEYEKKLGWNETVENDINSHLLLCTAFCKTDQDRLWVASLEAKLFMARLNYYSVDYFDVLKKLNIPLEKVENLSERLMNKMGFTEKKGNNQSQIYKIPFEFTLNLVVTMQYVLYKGYVFISKAELHNLIETVFKDNILRKMDLIRKHYEKLMKDSRICHIINSFHSKREVESIVHTFNAASETMTLKDLEASADKLFPLCMQLSHKYLTANSHLTHNGRLQYGLFLKGTGLTLEESLNFWKNKFSKKINEDKFNREYAYNIRHNYGKEGKRVDYLPWSCVKIQNLPPPSTSDAHGCPFKTMNDEAMRMLLFSTGMKELDVLKILEKKKNNEYSVYYLTNQ